MKFSLPLFLASVAVTDAFVSPAPRLQTSMHRAPKPFVLNAMSEAEIASLKAQAAKAREEANRLAKVSILKVETFALENLN